MDLRISDAVENQRYEAALDGRLAGVLEYMVRGNRIALIHTEVDPSYSGQGIGSRLARFALDDARGRGLRVIPSCPYVRTFLERHPEYQDLITKRAGPDG
jgi:uncharacterized protein